MNEQAPENGHREVRTLPVTSFGTGPKFPLAAEIAVNFLHAAYELNPELFGLLMNKAATGTPITCAVKVTQPRGNGRQVSGSA